MVMAVVQSLGLSRTVTCLLCGFAASIFLSTPARCALPTCTKVDDCACKLDDGKRIDIRSLGYQGSKAPRFDFQPPVGLENWVYAFNPCYDFSNAYCKNVIACQKAASSNEAYDLGKASSAVWGSDSDQYTITYTDGLRTTVVDLVCSTSATQPTLLVRGQTDPSKDIYYFTLTTECACPGQCGGPAPPQPAGLSPGSVLCIIFSVLLVVYFVGGMCFMKFVRGAGGKEIIPNVNFWSELPGTIKDGAKFTVGLCKTDSKYENL